MNDILLTKNEAFKAVSQGMENWDVAGRPLNQSMWYEQQALCRAQVRKVVEWAKGNNCAPLQADGKRTYTAHLVLPRDAWQALKAAGEGE